MHIKQLVLYFNPEVETSELVGFEILSFDSGNLYWMWIGYKSQWNLRIKKNQKQSDILWDSHKEAGFNCISHFLALLWNPVCSLIAIIVFVSGHKGSPA